MVGASHRYLERGREGWEGRRRGGNTSLRCPDDTPAGHGTGQSVVHQGDRYINIMPLYFKLSLFRFVRVMNTTSALPHLP